MLKIRRADPEEYKSVRDFYYSLIDAMEQMQYKPRWEKDVYPSQAFLREAIDNHELFIGESEGQIISCMAVNHKFNEEYDRIQWSVAAEKQDLLVIHALGVHPAFANRGAAKQMVKKVIDTARENNVKTIRLDVLEGNIPAEKVYRKMGFRYVDTIPMFYEDTGWTDFRLFEYII